MAIRNIRQMGDDLLRKTSKPVEEMTPRIRALIDDMFETMYEADGVGLAAPQVGILKRIFVVDVSVADPDTDKYAFINPEILEMSGELKMDEGCLSVPGKHGTVIRPEKIKIRAQNTDMEWFELEADGFLARAIQHEYDHLDGILYVDKLEGKLEDNED